MNPDFLFFLTHLRLLPAPAVATPGRSEETHWEVAFLENASPVYKLESMYSIQMAGEETDVI